MLKDDYNEYEVNFLSRKKVGDKFMKLEIEVAHETMKSTNKIILSKPTFCGRNKR